MLTYMDWTLGYKRKVGKKTYLANYKPCLHKNRAAVYGHVFFLFMFFVLAWFFTYLLNP